MAGSDSGYSQRVIDSLREMMMYTKHLPIGDADSWSKIQMIQKESTYAGIFCGSHLDKLRTLVGQTIMIRQVAFSTAIQGEPGTFHAEIGYTTNPREPDSFVYADDVKVLAQLAQALKYQLLPVVVKVVETDSSSMPVRKILSLVGGVTL